mmetsp:Transcript_16049/g.53940  ORF Transcript_16049/g.53940 Transcript_16049/m.53940 type:complete len:264 (+) Transcript_16049:271-1062(+)
MRGRGRARGVGSMRRLVRRGRHGDVDARRLLEELPGDDEVLHLRGAFVDLRDSGVAVEALRGHVRDEAHAAQHLDGLVRAHGGRLRRAELGHGRLLGEVLARVLEHRGAPGEQAGALDGAGHLGELELDGVHAGDGRAEGLALHGIFCGHLEGRLGDAQRLRGDADAPAVEGGHSDLEALPRLAQHGGARDAHLVHDQVGRGGPADAQLVFLGAQTEPGGVSGDQEGTDALVLLGLVRGGEYDGGGGLVRVGDPRLGPAQHKV